MGINGKQHFPDILKPSNMDEREFPVEVGRRFYKMRDWYLKRVGNDLIPPPQMKYDIKRWLAMIARHNHGDFRHTEAEWQSVKTIAQWLINVYREMSGLPEVSLDSLIQRMKEDFHGGIA